MPATPLRDKLKTKFLRSLLVPCHYNWLKGIFIVGPTRYLGDYKPSLKYDLVSSLWFFIHWLCLRHQQYIDGEENVLSSWHYNPKFTNITFNHLQLFEGNWLNWSVWLVIFLFSLHFPHLYKGLLRNLTFPEYKIETTNYTKITKKK